MVYKCKDLDTFIKENDDKSTEYLEYLADFPKNKDYDCSRTQWQDANYRYILLVILYFKKIP